MSVLWARTPFAVPAAAAVVYLRLHRTRPLVVTSDTLKFGFHAAAPRSHAEVLRVVALLDRLLFQARRRAAVLAGYQLFDDLISLQTAAGGMPSRGISALLPLLGPDHLGGRTTRLADVSVSADGVVQSLDDVCATHRILVDDLPEGLHARDMLRWSNPATTARLDPDVVERILSAATASSLAIGLVAAETLGRYRWEDPLDLAAVLSRVTGEHLLGVTA
jgi:hypothetical protein